MTDDDAINTTIGNTTTGNTTTGNTTTGNTTTGNTTTGNTTTGNATTNDTTTGDTTIVAVKRKRNRFHTENNTWFKTKDICQLYGVYESTVRNWERTGKIKSIKTPSGYRLFDKQSILANIGQISPDVSAKKDIIYCRVSSSHQKEDLSRQCDYLQSRYPNHQLVTDIGSGINFKRKGLQTILELAMSGNLGELVVSYKDRLARFGFELIEWIIKRNKGTLTILDQSDHKSGQQELAEDLLSIITVFNCRNMGRRRYSAADSKSKDQTGDEKHTTAQST